MLNWRGKNFTLAQMFCPQVPSINDVLSFYQNLEPSPPHLPRQCTEVRFAPFFSFKIYYCHSSKSTGKETDKTHLCALSHLPTVLYCRLSDFKWRSIVSLAIVFCLLHLYLRQDLICICISKYYIHSTYLIRNTLPERIYNPITAMFTFQLDNTKR